MPNPTTNGLLSRRPMVLGLAKILCAALAQIPFVRAAPAHLIRITEEKGLPADSPNLWIYLSVAIFLVLLGGIFAGLTIALMGQDEIYLQVIRDSGEGKEKVHAAKVLNLLQKGKHWVLVTLLLSNVITNETLPIVLDRSLGGGWPAVVGSTVLIVIFGEVIPQSVCVRYGLSIGAWMSPAVLLLMYLMAPAAWPTAKLLDWLLGKDHGTTYKKAGLKTLVSLHRSIGDAGQRLHADEVTIISAVLDLKEKTVGSIMTPMDDVFTLSLDDILDEDTIDDILSQGYSRIPVHHPDNDENFVGMLLVKMLITYDPEDAKPVRDFALATLPETKPDTSCLDIVNFFQEGKSHMVLVSTNPGEDYGAIGVVTLEDVIEELIGEEIIDESDVFIDIHKAIRRINPAPRLRYSQSRNAHQSRLSAVNTNGDLIDIDESEPLVTKDIHRSEHLGPPITLIASHERRQSAQSVKRAEKLEEVKEHFKHLGPSNLASRPKSTRFASVKIKPGSIDANAPSHRSSVAGIATPQRRISHSGSDFAGGIGEGLLKSGGRPASDGVQALHQGYGTISSSPNDKRPGSSSKAVQADPADLDDTSASLRLPLDGRESNDDVGELSFRAQSKSPYLHHRGPARSGSITENFVDTNGFRKMVLETTSSSEGTSEDEVVASKSQPNLSTSFKDASTTDLHKEVRDYDDGSLVKKKRKSRKKKGKNENSHEESQPLL